MTGLSDKHLKLIENRGLDPETASRLGVETCEGKRSNLIRIPYLVGSEVVNVKYRSLDGEKIFFQEQDGRKCFYNMNVITDASLADLPLVITEGEPDCWAAIESGFPRTVSVPDGAPAEALGEDDRGAKYSYVRDAEPAMRDIREIILATDGDGPGINLMNDLALRLGKARCKWLDYPLKAKGSSEKCKDLNEVKQRYGAAGVQKTIGKARWVEVDGVYRMSELPPIVPRQALDCGMPELGRHYKLRLGDFVVVTGVPNHGKSVFVDDVCCRMVVEHGWDVAFASFETPPQDDHRDALLTWYWQKQPAYQRPEEVCEADQWIDRHFSFVCPSDDDDVTVQWLLKKLAASVIRHGSRIVVVDPWNEMDHIRPDFVSREEYTGIAIKEFRRFARKYQVHFIVVAHPTKLPREKDGKLPIPSLYDIADAAHWANKADVGVIVHRSGEGNGATIRIAKVRAQKAVGKPGDVKTIFDDSRGRFVVEDDSGRLL